MRTFNLRAAASRRLNCRYDGRCVYDDGFDAFLADIYRADAIVYAFTPRDHSMGARFKMFDDRGFFTALRDPARGKPTAYIINGEYETEDNRIAVLEVRAQMSQKSFSRASRRIPRSFRPLQKSLPTPLSIGMLRRRTSAASPGRSCCVTGSGRFEEYPGRTTNTSRLTVSMISRSGNGFIRCACRFWDF
ncbi:MAG: hypothetical protein V8S87_04235 [Oscillospiraceae bacterium]